MAWFAVGSGIATALGATAGTAAVVGTAAAVGGAAVTANQMKKAGSATNNALNAQKQLVSDLQYEPIDIEKLKADATANAISNATQSLALERELQPDIAATREELARQTSEELKLGGKLGTDAINTVNKAGRTIGSRSGIGFGNTVPLTAGLLGLSSLDLANSRRAAANNLLNNNPLPAAGLDPGTIASMEVAQNAAQNQFNLEKSGVQSNLVQGEAEARAAQIGAQTGMVSSLVGALGRGIGEYNKTPTTSSYADELKKVPKTSATYYNQNPAMNPLMSTGRLS